MLLEFPTLSLRNLSVAHLSLHVALLFFGAATTHAQLPNHQLHAVNPVGGQRGQSVNITVAGADLVDIRQLVFSDNKLTPQLVPGSPDALTELSQPQWGNFSLAIPPEQPVGIYEVWCIGRYGVSNSRRFVIDSLATFNDPGNNAALSQAAQLTLPTAVAGRCDSAVIDYYKLDLKEGEAISIECWAKAIDSRLTPLISIQNRQGKDLLSARGSDAQDPILQFIPPTTDTYFLTVRDFLLEGGSNSFYWLRVKNGTAIEQISPSIALPATSVTWKGLAHTVKPGSPVTNVEIPGSTTQLSDQPAPVWKSERLPFLRPLQATIPLVEIPNGDDMSKYIVLATAGAKIQADIQPSTQIAEPTSVELPAEITSRFAEQAKDQFFKFQADKDTKLVIEVSATRLGQIADPIISVGRIVGPDMPVQWLSTFDDPPNRENSRRGEFDLLSDDPVGELTVPETGTYCVRIRNQYRSLVTATPNYHLSIRPATPDFQLFAGFKQLKRGGDQQTPLAALNLVPGSSQPIQIQVLRKDGFNEAIPIKVTDLPTGVSASPLLIPAGRSDGWLLLSATADAQPVESSISITAEVNLATQKLLRNAIPLVVSWDSPDRNNVPATFRVSSRIMLAVAAEPPRVSLNATSDKPLDERQYIVAAPGEELKLTFNVKRENGFAGEVKLKQQGLPDPWGSPEVTLAPDAAQAQWTVKIPAENSAGVYNVFFRGDLPIPFQPNPHSIIYLNQTKEKLVQKQQQAQQEKDAATAASNQEQLAAADAKLNEINTRIMQNDKQLDEANKANAVQNKDVAVWSNSFVLEVKAPSP
jgi:hypothetical protein